MPITTTTTTTTTSTSVPTGRDCVGWLYRRRLRSDLYIVQDHRSRRSLCRRSTAERFSAKALVGRGADKQQLRHQNWLSNKKYGGLRLADEGVLRFGLPRASLHGNQAPWSQSSDQGARFPRLSWPVACNMRSRRSKFRTETALSDGSARRVYGCGPIVTIVIWSASGP